MIQLIVEPFWNGGVSDVARSNRRSLASVYWVIGKFQWTGSIENLPRSDRPVSMAIGNVDGYMGS